MNKWGYRHDLVSGMRCPTILIIPEHGLKWKTATRYGNYTFIVPVRYLLTCFMTNFMYLKELSSFYTRQIKNTILVLSRNKGTTREPGGFATGLLYGNTIVVEYYLPREVKESGIISIVGVVHGYRYINIPSYSTQSLGSSGACQVNVNCPEGANWQEEKNAVALILVDENRYCTGSLINTTHNDNRPLFLTADHCLGGWANSTKHDAITNPNLSHWSFYWHYESYC